MYCFLLRNKKESFKIFSDYRNSIFSVVIVIVKYNEVVSTLVVRTPTKGHETYLKGHEMINGIETKIYNRHREETQILCFQLWEKVL